MEKHTAAHRQHRLQKTSNILLIVSSGLLLVFAAASGSFGYYYYDQAAQARRELADYKAGGPLVLSSIGATISRPGVDITIDEVLLDTAGIRELPATPSKQFVMVQVKIKNKTEKVVSFLPVLQTYLRDGNGVKYEITTAPNIKQAAVAGPIAPGDTVSGQIGFQVPVAVQGRLKFYYDMNAFGVHDLAIFDITPTNDKTESST